MIHTVPCASTHQDAPGPRRCHMSTTKALAAPLCFVLCAHTLQPNATCDEDPAEWLAGNYKTPQAFVKDGDWADPTKEMLYTQNLRFMIALAFFFFFFRLG